MSKVDISNYSLSKKEDKASRFHRFLVLIVGGNITHVENRVPEHETRRRVGGLVWVLDRIGSLSRLVN